MPVNCILIYNPTKTYILFCKRTRDPYKGLFNLVGGKLELNEDGFTAAYRELEEETGITRQDVILHHMMDFTYYSEPCLLEVYAGVLKHDVILREEAHPLVWLDATLDFYSSERFAGEGSIGHMVDYAKRYGLGVPELINTQKEISILQPISTNIVTIGVDGCKGGWIAAILDHGELIIKKYTKINTLIAEYNRFDAFLIDMVIGLQSSIQQIRPDTYARALIKERTSTIFPAPCRQAVYADNVAFAYEENERVLGKKFTPLTVGIMPKMRELDSYLQDNPDFKNRIVESHPEVCFAVLNGRTVLSRKIETEGQVERMKILSRYLPELKLNQLQFTAKEYRCNLDDIIDAVCLVVTANLSAQGFGCSLPEHPMEDETGLLMQMVIPQKTK